MSVAPTRMRPADLVGLAFSALGRHKARTALTILGVAIGTFALIASVAVGRGVDRAILGLFRGTDALRQVGLYLRWKPATEGEAGPVAAIDGAMSDAKRERLGRALARKRDNRGAMKPKAPLGREGLDRLAAIAHVERVVPVVVQNGTAALVGKGEPREAQFSSVDPDDAYRDRLVAGRGLSGDGAREAIVHELLLYQLGLVDDVEQVLGRPIRFEYRTERGGQFTLARLLAFGPQGFTPAEGEAVVRALKRLIPMARLLPIPAEERAALVKLLERTPAGPQGPGEDRFAETFTIVGVVREATEEDEKRGNMIFPGQWRGADVLLPPRTAADFYLRSPMLAEGGLNSALLTVDSDANVKDVSKAVEELGYHATSLIQVIETVRMNVLMITCATAFIAVVALAVAAIGITNTMVMSVLERTHEIGIMKALGARTGQVRTIFLVEGAVIGLVGGLLGLLLAWLSSFPGDSVAKSIMQAQAPRPVTDSLFAFSPWLVVGSPVLATIVTMLSAVYPAHRAARVDPITSLRHE